MNDKQEHALEAIHHYAKHHGTNLWSHIHPSHLVKSLEERVRHPNTINQRGSSWCGPAAVCVAMATEAPTTYAHMIIQLVQHGRATVHHGRLTGHTLKASPELRAYPFAKSKIVDADWIPMSTLRESLKSNKKHDTAWFFKHGTFPADVMEFYRDLGYSHLADHTSEWNMLAAGTFDYGLSVIQSANHLIRTNHRITMRINADMLDGGKQGANAKLPPQSVRHNHWVDLISPIHVGGTPHHGHNPRHGPNTPVNLTVFSWGNEMPVPQIPPMTLREFAANFFGFISAKY